MLLFRAKGLLLDEWLFWLLEAVLSMLLFAKRFPPVGRLVLDELLFW